LEALEHDRLRSGGGGEEVKVTPELERVAQALRPFFSGADLLDGEHYNAARSALLAIREPSKGMSGAVTSDLAPVVAWTAIMDHILGDSE